MRRLLVLFVLTCVQNAHADTLIDRGVKLRNIAEYAQAADAFERFARENPADEQAPRALSDAIVLRLGLGDGRAASDDAERYLKSYATRPEAGRIALALALHAAEKDDWASVERGLSRNMVLIERGPVSLVMVAHATLARAFARHPGDARASREYARVRALGEHAPTPPSDYDAMREWARGADAFAEALVFAADEKRDATTWAPFPAYSGGDVDAWIATKVTPWIAARSAAIGAVADDYKKVSEIQPIAPPRWVVAASARVAQLWTRASDEMLAHVSKASKDKLDAAARPLRDAHAKPAALACVGLAVEFEWSDDASQACGAWLEKTYPRQFPPLHELAIAPRFRTSNPIRLDALRP